MSRLVVAVGSRAADRLLLRLLVDRAGERVEERHVDAPPTVEPPPSLLRRVARRFTHSLRGASDLAALLDRLPAQRDHEERVDEYIRIHGAGIRLPADDPLDLDDDRRQVLGPGATMTPDSDLPVLRLRLGRVPRRGPGEDLSFCLAADRRGEIGYEILLEKAGECRRLESRRVDVATGRSPTEVEGRVLLEAVPALARRALGRIDEAESDSVPGSPATSTEAGRRRKFALAAGVLDRRTWPGRVGAVEAALRLPGTERVFRDLPPAVYVFLYHSVFDSASAKPWERAYSLVATEKRAFRAHLELLTSLMDPIPLSEMESAFSGGFPEHPRFAITFDDGYQNVLDNALPICRAHGVRPTVFVNSDFLTGRDVYYRVTLHLLLAEGRGEQVATAFNEAFGTGDFTAGNLLRLTKERYEFPRTQETTRKAWEAAFPDRPLPAAHLTPDELRRFSEEGGEVGSHTRSHATLSHVDDAELSRQIDGNDEILAGLDIPVLPWLSYPNGRARHVDPRVAAHLDGDPGRQGIHASGGVNFLPSRLDWLRIPLSNEPARELPGIVRRHAGATAEALRAAYPWLGP